MNKPGNRLLTVAGFVPRGSRVADIGTDHGYLTAYMIREGIASFVYACDIKEKPLNNARRNIPADLSDRVEFRLCDGLDGFSCDEVDTIVIAGMGGEVVSGILGRANWTKDSRYTIILQPMTSPEELRRYLYSSGYGIVSEKAVEDAGRLYSVMQVRYSGEPQNIQPYRLFLGEIDPEDDTGKMYIKKQLKRLSRCRDDISNIPAKSKDYKYYNDIIEKLSEIIGGK